MSKEVYQAAYMACLLEVIEERCLKVTMAMVVRFI